MKVKTKQVPYIEMIGDWMRVTYKEETVIEESFLKRLFKAFMKSYSWIYVLGIMLQVSFLFLGKSTKVTYACSFFWIGMYFTIIILSIHEKFKNS